MLVQVLAIIDLPLVLVVFVNVPCQVVVVHLYSGVTEE